MSNDLITVPTFTFKQGDFYDEGFERPIQVLYLNSGSIIGLKQDDQTILVKVELLNKLVRAIKANLPEAKKALSR